MQTKSSEKSREQKDRNFKVQKMNKNPNCNMLCDAF